MLGLINVVHGNCRRRLECDVWHFTW